MLVVLGGSAREPPAVEYWLTCAGCAAGRPPRGNIQRAAVTRSHDRWVAELEGVPSAGGQVAYRVLRGDRATEPSVFRAGPLARGHFRCAAIGGTSGDLEVQRALVAALDADDIDFLIHTGEASQSASSTRGLGAFLSIAQPLLAQTPILPVLGRDEHEDDRRLARAFVTELWTDTSHYYHADWGNLRLVFADLGLACPGGCLESRYVQRALREGARRGMLLALVVPVPPDASSAWGSATARTAWRDAVTALTWEHGVELVLAGYDPVYERAQLRHGTASVVTGNAGAARHPLRPRRSSRALSAEPHYVLLDVASDRLTVRAIDVTGRLIDVAVVRAVPARAESQVAAPDAPGPAPEQGP